MTDPTEAPIRIAIAALLTAAYIVKGNSREAVCLAVENTDQLLAKLKERKP